MSIENGASLVRVSSREPLFRGFVPAVRSVLAYRELLLNLVRQQLRVKYKNSILGFLWSLLRPLFLLGIYFLVFGLFLQSPVPNFAFYLFAGLMAWDLFASTLSAATVSIVGNAGLIKKVYFPREILPLAAIGAGLFHFFLQLLMLLSVLLIFRFDFVGPNLLLLPVALLALVLFLTGMSLLLSAANVYLRDVQYLLEIFLLLWFWLTPIVYPVAFAVPLLSQRSFLGVNLFTLYLADPMAVIVVNFQKAIYKNAEVVNAAGDKVQVLLQGDNSDYLTLLLRLIVFCLVFVWFSQRLFARAQGNFAQEV